MEYITDTCELKGKTIKSAKHIDADESLVIIFEDDTCIFLKIDQCGDSVSIQLSEDSCPYQERGAGIISDSEYEVIVETARQISSQSNEKAPELFAGTNEALDNLIDNTTGHSLIPKEHSEEYGRQRMVKLGLGFK